MKDSRFINLNAAPLQQYVEDRHQKPQAHLEILPDSMLHLLAVTYPRQQRKDTFNDHPHVPCPALADFHILRVTRLTMKSRVGTDDHSPLKVLQQRVKFGVRDIGRLGLPGRHRPPLVQHDTEFAANNPARIRFAFLADALTLREPQFSDRMTELNAERIRHAQQRRLGQKERRPPLVSFEQPSQASAFRQMGKQRQVIALDPAIEMAQGGAFESEEQSEGDDLARIEFGLRMFLNVLHLLINAAEKFYNEVSRGHGAISPCFGFVTNKIETTP